MVSLLVKLENYCKARHHWSLPLWEMTFWTQNQEIEEWRFFGISMESKLCHSESKNLVARTKLEVQLWIWFIKLSPSSEWIKRKFAKHANKFLCSSKWIIYINSFAILRDCSSQFARGIYSSSRTNHTTHTRPLLWWRNSFQSVRNRSMSLRSCTGCFKNTIFQLKQSSFL